MIVPSLHLERARARREREVAVAQRELGEADGAALRATSSRSSSSSGSSSGREVRDEELLASQLAAGGCPHRSVEHDQTERQLRARVGVGDRPADSAAVAGDVVADERQRQSDERNAREAPLPHDRANHAAVVTVEARRRG